MFKTITKLTFGAFILASLNSCVSTSKGYQSSPVISRNVELDPIKADIKVNEKDKLKGESTSTYFLVFRVSGDNTFADGIRYSTDANASVLSQINPLYAIKQNRMSEVRASAAYNALSKGEYDFLVHPNYTVTVENYLLFKKYIVSVEGYGANYVNFRTEKSKVVVIDGKEYIFYED
jgi:ABC-type amino acid transport substrate-binding protein